LVLKQWGAGPGPVYFAAMSLGLVGFVGFFLAQLFAQRHLYPDWPRRMQRFVLFMAASMGLALSNTRAVWQGLMGRATPFTRTPKYGAQEGDDPWWTSRYAVRQLPPIVWAEAGMALYCTAGLVVLAVLGEWAALPFQAFFAGGFGLVTLSNIQHTAQARRAATA
jgi:hypothetical protein